MKILGMCINKKVVAGLAVAGLGIWWLAPGAIAAALPLLILAICPLSMLFMMKAMNMDGQQQGQQTAQPSAPPPPEVPAGQLTLPVVADGAADTVPVAPVDRAPARAPAATPQQATSQRR